MDKNKQHLLLSEDFKGLAKLMNGRFDELEENLKTEIKQSFNEVDDRFNGADKRFDAIDERFEKVEKRFDKIDGKLDKIEKTLKTNEKRDEVFAEKLNLDLKAVDAGAQG
ncbi:MAG: hypothetical protein US74_C0002G0034 [Parcubacteria group bacterium GW2011_GWA2_38_13]|nr:MAG: hypothetical protein US74_C0002G0034 [Parcubacteria group bacterium GW2011_GWA2_38_13]